MTPLPARSASWTAARRVQSPRCVDAHTPSGWASGASTASITVNGGSAGHLDRSDEHHDHEHDRYHREEHPDPSELTHAASLAVVHAPEDSGSTA